MMLTYLVSHLVSENKNEFESPYQIALVIELLSIL